MADLNEQIRYFFEHRLLPQELYSKRGSNVIIGMLEQKGEFFVSVLNLLGSEQGYKCPYSPSDFVLKPQLMRANGKTPSLAILAIDMPEPEITPLCSRIYICHDENFSRIRYYTLERSITGGNILCGWEKDSHNNYGSPPENEEKLFYKIYSLYTHYLENCNK